MMVRSFKDTKCKIVKSPQHVHFQKKKTKTKTKKGLSPLTTQAARSIATGTES